LTPTAEYVRETEGNDQDSGRTSPQKMMSNEGKRERHDEKTPHLGRKEGTKGGPARI